MDEVDHAANTQSQAKQHDHPGFVEHHPNGRV